MDSRPDTLSHADLLEHAEFLHRLARRLVRDEHRAEDLVQDAQLAALAGGPRDRNALRAWFAGVMRHLSSNARRSQVRSVARERAAARAEAVVPADELRVQLETQRVLATHVGELDEARVEIRHSSFPYVYWAEVVGHTVPWFWFVTGPKPLYTNFCRRFPSNVSVV